MELVTTLRELWRLRALVLVVALLAIVAGLAIAVRLPSFESRKYEVGAATTRILVDTPKSQVVEVAPKGSDVLGVRANLIANLMADGEVKAAIAERAGIAPSQLRGVAESAAEPPPASVSPVEQPYVLTTRVLATPDGERLPIIEVEVQAPDAARAARLAEGAVSGLRDYLDSKAAVEQVPDVQRLRVSGLGSPQAQDLVQGDRRLLGIVGALFVFLAGCAVIVAVRAFARGWRVAAEWDKLELEPDGYGADYSADFAALDELFDADRSHDADRSAVTVTTPSDYHRAKPAGNRNDGD